MMQIKWDERGLAPAIVIHAATGEVLMLAYMNSESFEKTETTGETWFWSRSRNALWHKGATSGNTQRVVSVTPDCDADTLLVRVIPKGPACHTGSKSCFGTGAGGIFTVLDDVLESRAKERPPNSYTTRLLQDENLRIKKIGEESAEFIQALLKDDNQNCVNETADLLFHVAVALRAKGLTLADVATVLEGRHSPKSSSADRSR
jgi:phosphoribosyl-ATP pyrophosphohydrolase/phosphoribosyl-AMP cyclohydrolase